MPHERPALQMSRRRLLLNGGAAVGALGTGAFLAACSSSASSKSSAGAEAGAKTGAEAGAKNGRASGPWSFTDDRKQALTAKSAPSRILAFTGTAAALVDLGLGDRVVDVFGETVGPDG